MTMRYVVFGADARYGYYTGGGNAWMRAYKLPRRRLGDTFSSLAVCLCGSAVGCTSAMSKRRDDSQLSSHPAKKMHRTDHTARSLITNNFGYVKDVYRSLDHVLEVSSKVFNGTDVECDADILANLPVNLCIVRDLISWTSKFQTEAWLELAGIKEGVLPSNISFYENKDSAIFQHNRENFRHSVPFNGAVIVDSRYKVIACIPTFLSWYKDHIFISFYHNNTWNSGRLGKPFCGTSKGAIWYIKNRFIGYPECTENIHHHEEFERVHNYPAKEYFELFFHKPQERQAASYKRLCEIISRTSFTFSSVTETEDGARTPEIIRKRPTDTNTLTFGSPLQPCHLVS